MFPFGYAHLQRRWGNFRGRSWTLSSMGTYKVCPTDRGQCCQNKCAEEIIKPRKENSPEGKNECVAVNSTHKPCIRTRRKRYARKSAIAVTQPSPFGDTLEACSLESSGVIDVQWKNCRSICWGIWEQGNPALGILPTPPTPAKPSINNTEGRGSLSFCKKHGKGGKGVGNEHRRGRMGRGVFRGQHQRVARELHLVAVAEPPLSGQQGCIRSRIPTRVVPGSKG